MELKEALKILRNYEDGDLTDIYSVMDRFYGDLFLDNRDPEQKKVEDAIIVFLGWILENVKVPE